MKAPAEMTNGEINRRLESLRKKASKINQAFIDAGRGHERPSEIRYQTDALSLRYMENQAAMDELRREAERRYGPGFTGTLPRQTTRRRKNPKMAAPFTTPKDEWQWANEAVARAKRELAELERQAKSYFDDDEINFTNEFRYALFKAQEKLKKAERKLKSTTKKLAKRTTNPMRKKITQKQLNALARGRRTAMANRKAKKKKVTRRPTRRKNPSDDNLPKWRGASAAYSKAYRLMEKYGADTELIKALNRGDEEKIKGILLEYATRDYHGIMHPSERGYKGNPAHGNYLNAIAAKARGGLGREAYQNPVRPLRKNAGQIIVRLKRDNTIDYWNGVRFTTGASKAIFANRKTAMAAAKKYELAGYLAIVPSHLTGTEIQAALISRRDSERS